MLSKALTVFAAMMLSVSSAQASVIAVDGDTGAAGIQPMAAGSEYTNFVVVPVGPFADTYNFSLASPLEALFLAVNAKNEAEFPGLGLVTTLDISGFSLDLYKENGAIDELLSDNVLSGQLPNLLAGDYYITVSGNGSGLFGGAYGITLRTVPEPQTLALALMGLGLMAFNLQRK